MTDAQIADTGLGAGPGTAAEPGRPPSNRWQALRQPEALIPLVLVGIFLVIWVLVLARPTFLTSFDLWARNHIQDVAHATQGKNRWPVFKKIADLGGGVAVQGVPFQIQVPMVAMALVGLGAALLRRSWRPVLAMAAGYAALLVVLFLKAVGDRPGPSMAGQAMSGGLGYFPSGHTGNTMLGYGTAALILAFVFTGHRMRIAITVAMTLWALTVGFSLVWMDFHWVSDVLGSYALCGAMLFGVARVLGFRISSGRA
ncbi:phosphatase PAP2 family protein [Catenulispora rubra]|uniref:phosphatase PAP2 family protein n=1 Tax=Catenulispora rubra TaxID=280293 RepID=UPI00189244A6|nr:phosphatase PAP2 family protein [Catenulispora rubra]